MNIDTTDTSYETMLRDDMAMQGAKIFGPGMISEVAQLPNADEKTMTAVMALVWASAYMFANQGMEIRKLILDASEKKRKADEQNH
jgi:diacylglycerol kinase family enzyme